MLLVFCFISAIFFQYIFNVRLLCRSPWIDVFVLFIAYLFIVVKWFSITFRVEYVLISICMANKKKLFIEICWNYSFFFFYAYDNTAQSAINIDDYNYNHLILESIDCKRQYLPSFSCFFSTHFIFYLYAIFQAFKYLKRIELCYCYVPWLNGTRFILNEYFINTFTIYLYVMHRRETKNKVTVEVFIFKKWTYLWKKRDST